MRLEDVKIDGSTTYRCRKNARYCVIVASFVADGACLVAGDMSDGNFMDLWATEARWLSSAEDTNRDSDEYVLVSVTKIPKPCDHDWDNEGCNPESCLKCGMSFTRYVHTECP